MKINIITENEGGSDEPVLATFDTAKAKARYLEVIQKVNSQETDVRQIADFRDHRTDDDGIERATYDEQEYVCIDGIWYEIKDEYGDTIVRWFVLDFE